MAQIIFESGPRKGKSFDATGCGSVDAGRESGCFLVVPDHKVSRHRSCLAVDGSCRHE